MWNTSADAMYTHIIRLHVSATFIFAYGELPNCSFILISLFLRYIECTLIFYVICNDINGVCSILQSIQ